MTFPIARIAGASAALMLLAQSAAADLTPTDVWADFRAQMEGQGYTVAATEDLSGDVLTISNLKMSVTQGRETVTLSTGDLSLTFMGHDDGSVTVGMPDSFPITTQVGDSTDDDVNVVMDITQSGHAMTVTGNPGDMTYDYTADAVGMEVGLQQAAEVSGGERTVATDTTVLIGLDDVVLKSAVKVDTVRSVQQQMTASGMRYTLDTTATAEDQAHVTVEGAVAEMVADSNYDLPLDKAALDPEDSRSYFNAGLALGSTVTFGENGMTVEGAADGGTFALHTFATGGTYSISMDGDAISFDTGTEDVKLSLNASQLPFPVELTTDSLSAGLTMPLGATKEPQDFGLKLGLTDFTMSDTIWSILDPGSVLPRDPATLSLDLTGKATLLTDLMAPDLAETLDEEPPAQLDSVSLNSFLIKAIGAQLKGNGSATFDNTDTTTFEGYPRPTGKMSLELKGGNALLDSLVKMGLVTSEQSMAARMMMGLFGVPGGDDTLTSTLEINRLGEILANGQRIQ
ncbi:DUF2125 domain-containing protein [Chachezhania sediminis]|uniref:DUF2125 domain-containing protein n=1 Tax=Chachezhania sediminis TaxID=2599291 RepID=UPI00131BCDF3|nr:DUF2125 domain-containing protein [Chachezhania sediminis]